MDITTSNLSAIVTAFDMRLQDVWDNTFSFMEKVGTTVPCSSSTLQMPWLQVFPQLREWFGERVFNDYIANSISFTPKLFELTESIKRTEIEDDMHNLWLGMAPQRIAREIRLQPDKLISALLESNPKTFDGVAFFAANHPVDFSKAGSPTTNDNTLTTAALTADNVQALRAKLVKLQGADGLPLNFIPNVLMVRPEDELTAKIIANSAFYPTSLGSANGNAAGPVSNVMQGVYEVVVNPYLTTTSWYLLCTTQGVSPLLWIERIAPQMQYMVDPDEFVPFMRDEFAIGCRRRAVPGLGLYYLAGRGTP